MTWPKTTEMIENKTRRQRKNIQTRLQLPTNIYQATESANEENDKVIRFLDFCPFRFDVNIARVIRCEQMRSFSQSFLPILLIFMNDIFRKLTIFFWNNSK